MPFNILQVGTADAGGGAAAIANSLMRVYAERGCRTWLAVGRKTSRRPNVLLIPDDGRRLYRLSGYEAVQRGLRSMAGRYPSTGWGRISRSVRLLTHPSAVVARWRGEEDFEYPGTWRLLSLPGEAPDIVHCHNLHGGFFDLRALTWLSHRVPTVLTLHDAWTMSGHCAHSFECERWKTGCGECPDLAIDPAIRRDATAGNWIRKQAIYARSRLFVATPSEWLMRKVEQSMLAPGVAESRVIPNGVDLTVFHPADRRQVRAELGLPDSARVVLVTAGGLLDGTWMDHRLLRRTVELVAGRSRGRETIVVAVGRQTRSLRLGDADLRFVGHQQHPHMMARYHQAADVYVHAARADTFPTMVIEALACGTPVVAAAVGGIPEQIRSVGADAIRTGDPMHLRRATGVLVGSGAAEDMADAVCALLDHEASRRVLGANAAADARLRFDVNRQADEYLRWYSSILESPHHSVAREPEEAAVVQT